HCHRLIEHTYSSFSRLDLHLATTGHRHSLPVTLGRADCSFQLGRTSTFRVPHFPHFTRKRNHGTSTSLEYLDTSISAECRQEGMRQWAMSRCTPSWRMVPNVIGFIVGLALLRCNPNKARPCRPPV